MSNVLIGIVGLILFIGLTLAGTMFLGDAWQKSRRQASALQVMEHTNQISSAVLLRQAQEQINVISRSDIEASLISTHFLKVLPIPPIGGENYGLYYGSDISSTIEMADVVLVSIGSSQEACETIDERGRVGFNVGQPLNVSLDPINLEFVMTQRTGCFQTGVGIPILGATAGDFVAYSRL